MGELTGLGRRYSADPRDLQHRLEPKRAVGIDTRMWFKPPVLDQGATSECVGHATRSYLSAGPCTNKGGPDQHEIYREARKVDEWPGENYDGTSVRGAMKVLKTAGLVSEYRWATSVDDVLNHVLTTGPIIMGTEWFYGMLDTDRKGFVEPTGSSVGGHAWLIVGANRSKGLQAQNSWGKTWGTIGGRFWLTFDHLAPLLAQDGEAAVAVEVKRG